MTPQHTTLENGLELIAQPLPHAKSVALAVLLRSGARDDQIGGTAHFLEHMMFKSGKYSALELSKAFDEIGAHANAFTSHDLTTYTAFALPEQQSRLTELLLGMMQPALALPEIELERQVILEEIELYRDDPMSLALEHSAKAYFGDHPLGNPVIGSSHSVTHLKRSNLLAHLQKHYTSQNMVLAVCGIYDWQRLQADATRLSANLPRGQHSFVKSKFIVPKSTTKSIAHDSTHTHISFVANGFAAAHPLELAAAVAARILGDSENSRLFWALVHAGLALSASLEHEGHLDVGAFYGSIECSKEHATNCLEVLHQTLQNTLRTGIQPSELERMKRKLEVGLALRLETPNAWLGAFAEDFALQNDLRSPNEVLTQIREIRLGDVNHALEQSGLLEPVVVVLG